MQTLIAIVITMLASIGPALAASPRAPDLSSREAVLTWINTYRSKPHPDALPAAVRTLSKAGAFNNAESAGVYVGFFAGILGSNPQKADQLIGKMLPLPAEDQWIVVRAIAYSGLSDWKGLLRRCAGRMPARKVMIDKYLADQLPRLEHLVIKDTTWVDTVRDTFTIDMFSGNKSAKPLVLAPTPDVLDTLWGFYFATGDPRPIDRIIAMLPWSKERDDVDKLSLGSMARYTMVSNAARDPVLLAVLKAEAKKQTGDAATVLNQVIESAETVDTARVRKEALASIEELKRKGPGSKREMAWWGYLGEGALAVGCIVAAATGHIELGLPCVVGGALTSAGLRFMSSPQ